MDGVRPVEAVSEWSSRRPRLVLAVAVLLLLAGATLVLRRKSELESVSGVASRFTEGAERGEGRAEFQRSSRPDVTFLVDLAPAPVGRRLKLDCAWTDPSGAVWRQNHYSTQEITTPLWQTHCHQVMGGDSPLGVWRVTLSMGGRILREDSFALR
jgi:hypothetical protein